MGNGLEALATMWYHMAVNESKGRNIEAGVLQATPNFREVLYWEARPSPLEAKLLVPKSESAARIEASSIDIIQKHCDMPNFCGQVLPAFNRNHFRCQRGAIIVYMSSYHFPSLPVHFFLCCSRPAEYRTGPNLLPI